MGRDGNIRRAAVRIANSQVQPTTLHRPVQHLYPLEINLRAESQPNLTANVTSEDSDRDSERVAIRRSKQAAASEIKSSLIPLMRTELSIIGDSRTLNYLVNQWN